MRKKKMSRGIWFLLGVCFALIGVIGIRKCRSVEVEDKRDYEEVVEVVKRDTIYLEKVGGVSVKYVVDGSLLDSIKVYKVQIDSLQKNRVLVVNEVKSEVIKYVPVTDSLGQKLKDYFDLKDGDKVMKLPAMVEIRDDSGKWMRLRVLIDEKPSFVGGSIVSDLVRRDSLVKDNFWVKEWVISYEQMNPYLNKVNIQHRERKRKFKVLKFFKLKK